MKLEKLKIEAIAIGGSGIAFSEGLTIFIPHTAIGDVVDIELDIVKKDHAFGHAIAFHQRGEGTIEPQCPSFLSTPACGGCDWLMLSYPTQIEYKQRLVRDTYKAYEDRYLGYQPSPCQYGYRNKSYLPYGKEGYGIFATYSHEIVPFKRCLNHPPIFDEILAAAYELLSKAKVLPYNEVEHSGVLRHIGLKTNSDHSEVLLILVTKSSRLPFSKMIVNGLSERFPSIRGIIQNINRYKTNVILGSEDKLLYGDYYLNESLAGLRYRLHYKSFWQVNIPITELIVQTLKDALPKDAKLIDAYCGTGSLGLSLAEKASEVMGIEESEVACKDAAYNAQLNGIHHARYIQGRFEEVILDKSFGLKADCLLLDPPRSGVKPEALDAIREANIPLILYLSCSLPTQKRDVDTLTKDGLYKVKSIKGFDMFPNTWHTECLVILEIDDETL